MCVIMVNRPWVSLCVCSKLYIFGFNGDAIVSLQRLPFVVELCALLLLLWFSVLVSAKFQWNGCVCVCVHMTCVHLQSETNCRSQGVVPAHVYRIIHNYTVVNHLYSLSCQCFQKCCPY